MKQTDFNKKLDEQLSSIADSYHFDLSTQRGMAFQIWYSDLCSSLEGGFDTETDDAVLSTRDGGVDIIHINYDDKKLLLVQAKCRSLKNTATELWNEIEPFFKKHEDWLNDDYLKKLSRKARENLDIYKEAVKNKWSIEYRYVTTNITNSDLVVKVKLLESRIDQNNIEFNLIGRDDLRDYLTEAEFAEEGIQDEVQINFRKQKFSHWVDGDQEVVIGVVSGNELVNIYRRYRQALYAYNIRHYLGPIAFNKNIQETAENEGDKFFYYNNGVTAICTEIDMDDNKLTAKNFQIINGAQTVSSLFDAKSEIEVDGKIELTKKNEVEVLLRIVRSTSMKTTESGFNQKIIKYNNTQNVIKVSDFKSNDHVQIHLENNLHNEASNWGIPQFYYQRKRSIQKPRGGRRIGRKINLETLARIIYAFDFEDYKPLIISDQSKRLWTNENDQGLYEQVFGTEKTWAPERIKKILLGIGIYEAIRIKLTLLKKDDKENEKYDLRWWFLALASHAIKKKQISHDSLTKNKAKFEVFFDECFNKSLFSIKSIYELMVLEPNDDESMGTMKKRDFNRSAKAFLKVRDFFDQVY